MRARSIASLIVICLLLLGGCAAPSPEDQVVLKAEVAADALRSALSRVNCPYELGAEGPDRFDCSGLVIWAYRQAYPALMLFDGTVPVADVSANVLWQSNVYRIPAVSLRPGDPVFISSSGQWVTHMGLFVRRLDPDTIEIVDASSSSLYRKVIVEPWPLHGLKRGEWFVGAGRLKTVL